MWGAVRTEPIVSPEEIPKDAVLVDARAKPAGVAAYVEAHLEGAVHVDLDADLAGPVVDAARGGRHPLPSLEAFGALLGRLGIGPDTRVVIYDDQGGANAASRLYWMLRAVGHERVAVLDGGLAGALAAGVPTERGAREVAPRPPYPVRAWSLPTADIDEVAAAAADKARLVLDVRTAARYRGDEEPFDPIAGHIPGAKNLFFGENLGADGRFLPADALREKYQERFAGVPPENVIVHCGSGVTACHTLLALEQAGLAGAKLYVGSWGEWCRNEDRPRATGDEP
jgi:thiosulfate/3-mercaptopyruvate sulfurtransferase